mmetsp:Transcript_20106/g.36335  ORF Transcript_20106/g.36335 Transcript_20106/m.36335 type:complete len:131 (-) Transcript_20106:298-690(-)
MAEGYDPRRSKVSDDTMAIFLTQPITGDLTEVPGIGPKTVEKLAHCESPEDCITNTYQLFGKYLMLKGPGEGSENQVSTMVHAEKFWQWLKNRGISSHRSAIVKAIAEKSSAFFPAIYDANEYASDDEED